MTTSSLVPWPLLASFAVGVSLLGSGCTEHLPAPSPPAREVPKDIDVPPEPPPPGTGRVLIDANGERAKVVEITGSATVVGSRYGARIVGVRPVCTTPCVVDLPYGSHPFVLRSTTDETRGSELEVEVGTRPKVVRHALGEQRDGGAVRTAGVSVMVLGAITTLTGGLLWGLGGLVSSASDGADSGLVGAGRTTTAIGAAAMALSIPLLVLGRPSERPGATTEWSPPGWTEPRSPSVMGTTAFLSGAPTP